MKTHIVSRIPAIARLLIATAVLSSLGTIAADENTPTPKQPGVAAETKVAGVVLNVDKEPIADARIAFLGYAGDEANDFEPIGLRTDDQGRFEASVPSKRFRVYVDSPSDEYDSLRGFGVRDGQAICAFDGVVDRSTDATIRVVATLPRAYDLAFDLVDAETGRAVQDGAVLYKDDEVFWVSEYDYESSASWHVYRVFEDGVPTLKKTTSGTMELAHILILATGYEPLRLKLDEKFKRGRPLVKRIQMKPLAAVELTIATPGGEPAVGAAFESIRPKAFQEIFHGRGSDKMQRLLDLEETSNDDGVVRIRYPAFGDWAVYRVKHPAGYADLEVKDLAPIDGETTIRRQIEVAEYATIQGEYLPRVAENEFLEVTRLKPTRISTDGPSVRVELNEDGRFKLQPRLAGWHSFVHRIEYTDTHGRRCSSAVAIHGPFKLTNGQTLDLQVGGDGRPLIGRLVLPDGVETKKRVFSISVTAGDYPSRPHPPADIEDHDALLAWWDAFWESDTGRRHRYSKRRYGSTVADADGSFSFPMLPPGNYTLRLAHRTRDSLRLALGKVDFEIPAAPSAEPLDLGDLQLTAGR